MTSPPTTRATVGDRLPIDGYGPSLAVLGVQVPLEGADEGVQAERVHEQVG
jgi:hypothetical protein